MKKEGEEKKGAIKDRKSGSNGGGNTTLMGFRMIQCGRQTVPVIQPNGQIQQFTVPVKVSDILLYHPHHFVCYVNPVTGKRISGMLPGYTYLETGNSYAVLPLPRLFPGDPPHVPHLCACYLAMTQREATGMDAIKAEIKRYWPLGNPAFQSSKISPDYSDGSGCMVGRRLWEPALEMISEDRILINIEEEEEDREKESHLGKKLVSALTTLRMVSS